MENETQATGQEDSPEENPEEIKKRNHRIEVILFLVLGFLLGVVIKTEASKKIVIGFDDFKVKELNRGYDLNQVQKNLAEKSKQEQKEDGGQPASATEGGSNGQ